MEKEVIERLHLDFTEAVQTIDGETFMYARDLQVLLQYKEWRNFEKAIIKAKAACKNSNNNVHDHFVDINKVIEAGKGAIMEVDDIVLTRYACYLVAQNADSRKEQVAFAMNYFANKTIAFEDLEVKMKDWERLQARQKLAISDKEFSATIFQHGVDGAGYGKIKSLGDRALFGGLNTSQMKKRLGIPDKKPLGDVLPTITLKAKDFANEITSFAVKRDNLNGEQKISNEHVKNNKGVRDLLLQRGIKPENLPAESDIKVIEKKAKAENKLLLKEASKKKSKGLF